MDLIITFAYLFMMAVTIGVLVAKEYSPDPGIWLAVFWPLTLAGYLGTKIAKVFK